MTTPHFDQFIPLIKNALSAARSDIKIAVCWFTHTALFEVLMKQLTCGVRVSVVLEYDENNFKAGGPDWDAFIKNGGVLHANVQPALMHHKFAIVDGQTLLTGSFNWTYNQNHENLLRIIDLETMRAFEEEWDKLTSTIKPLKKVDPLALKRTGWFPFFENTQLSLPTMRQAVARGACMWAVRADREATRDLACFFSSQRLIWDRQGTLRGYWNNHRYWRKDWFLDWWATQSGSNVNQLLIKRWALRMAQGDFAVLTGPKAHILAIGLVQSEPKATETGTFSTFREVQWLRQWADAVEWPAAPIPKGKLVRYRGSALAVLAKLSV